jgi:hypothetical protein
MFCRARPGNLSNAFSGRYHRRVPKKLTGPEPRAFTMQGRNACEDATF